MGGLLPEGYLKEIEVRGRVICCEKRMDGEIGGMLGRCGGLCMGGRGLGGGMGGGGVGLMKGE